MLLTLLKAEVHYQWICIACFKFPPYSKVAHRIFLMAHASIKFRDTFIRHSEGKTCGVCFGMKGYFIFFNLK